jgi:S-adenosylmethionine/arginine decarboxylase-like enzyme
MIAVTAYHTFWSSRRVIYQSHSWPEHRYASVDVYTCGQVDPWRIFNEIALFLSPKVVSAVEVRRGVMREIINKGEEEPAIKGF